MTWLAYAADALILVTYAMVASGRYVVRLFHWANAIGCIPIATTEIAVGAWPALVLTTAFGIIGWVGVLTKDKAAR